MPEFYDFDPRSNQKRQKARLRRRRRLIIRTALSALVLIIAVFGVTRFFNKGNSKPSDVAVKPTATLNVEPPAVTAEQFHTYSSPAPSVNTPSPAAAATPAATVTPAAPPEAKAANSYKIIVSTAKQTVMVLDANDQLVKSFVCSTGLDGADTETPLGTYTVAERGESFFSQTYQQGAYYWTQFYGDYLFHSIPFDKNREIETAEASKLGTKASHGCVRLTIENAKWIYDNIPRGTTVIIE